MAEGKHVYWHKESYLPSDVCPVTRQVRGSAIPPGLYCETKAGLDALVRSCLSQGIPAGADVQADATVYSLGGVTVRVATAAETPFLKMLSRVPNRQARRAAATRP